MASWTTVPFSARQVVGATPHFRAAAATSISRAAAPALRKGSQEPRTLREPPVPMRPYFGSASAWTTRTLLQSASRSSATSIAIDVNTPCPISERAR